MSQLEEAEAYLNRLYGKADGYLTVWDKTTKRTKAFHTADLGAAAACMLARGASDDVYFGWALQSAPPSQGRGKAETTCCSPGIFFDADLFSEIKGVHSKTQLPRTRAEVEAWLREANFPPPTMMRSSGNGLYLDWLHPEPVVFATPEERSTYQAKYKAFHIALRTSAQKLRGWEFDSTDDLARVTRMPGTFNHKTNPAKPVEILQ